MGRILDLFNSVFADGPSTSPTQPPKSGIREIGAVIDAEISGLIEGLVIGGAVIYSTRAALYADLAHPAGRLGVVYNDGTAAYNGIYVKSGSSGSGSWAITNLALPSTFAADLSAAISEITAARQGEASIAANLTKMKTATDLVNHAKVWNAVDPMTISEVGVHIITNATNLPTGWPTGAGLTAALFVWQFGGALIRDLRANSMPEAEWRSRNGAAWTKSSAYLIGSSQLSATYAYKTLATSVDLNTLLDEGTYIANGAYTHGPPGFGDTAFIDVRTYGNFRIQSLRGGTIMDRVWQRQGNSSGVFGDWESVGGLIGGGTGFSIAGKTVVVIGDSIVEFGDWPERMAARFGMTVHKFGFGGCRMGYYPSSPNGYDTMCMYRLAENIASGDFTTLVNGAIWLRDNAGDDNTAQANAMAALDWGTVDYILICFGTNDWTGNIGLNGTQAPDPTGADFDGALAYAIEQIQTAHPAIKIGVVSPAFRVRDTGTPNVNSDNEALAGLVLPDYVEACGKVAEKYHVPWFDLYNNSGVNRYTFAYYLQDGTHPKTGLGYELWSEKVGSWMATAF